MQNLLTKYNRLRQELWFHIATYSGYCVCLPSFILYKLIFTPNITSSLMILFLFLTIIIYPTIAIIICSLAFLNHFQKIKITKKFFTQNKTYGTFCFLGNLIFFAFTLCVAYIISSLILNKFVG